MKKLGIVVGLLVIALSISSASALTLEEIWEENFGPIFGGNVFNSSSVFNDTVEQEKLENVTSSRSLSPGWANETPSRIFKPGWANETRHSNFPVGYFNVTPKEEWSDKPANWFNETPREQHTNFPPGWFD